MGQGLIDGTLYLYLDELQKILSEYVGLNDKQRNAYLADIKKLSIAFGQNIDRLTERIEKLETESMEVSIAVLMNELTGSGGIIKTAGFAITNDRMRNSEFYRKMMKNMTNRTWKDSTGKDYVADITKNFKKESINYGTFYFKRGNKYYEATIRKAEGDNAYYRDIVEINQDGNVVENGINKSELFTDVNNNYKLWEMFGGMHSQEFNGGLLQPSETSLEMVVKAVINTGEIKESGTHKELLKQEGIYYNLYKNQFINEQMDKSIK